MAWLRSLSLKTSVVFALVALIPLTIGVSYAIISGQKLLTKAIGNEILVLGEKNIEYIEEWFNQRMREMKVMTEYPAVRDPLALSPILAAAQKELLFYENVIYVDDKGQGIVASNPNFDVASFNVWDREWFQQVRTGKDTFSDPLLSRATGNMVVTVAAPVMENGVFKGAVRGAVQLDTLFDLVANQKVSYGGQSYLLSGAGEPVIQVRGAKADGPLNTDAAVHIRQGGRGFSRYEGPDGAEVFGMYAHIPLAGMGLVVEVPVSEALASTKQLARRSTVLAIVMGLIAVGVGLLFARYLTAPVRRIIDLLGGLSQGDLSAAVDVDRNDEIAAFNWPFGTCKPNGG